MARRRRRGKMPLRKMQNTIYPCKHLFTASYLAVFFCRYSRIS
ncbi:hypothetical protein AB28_2692 [Raoultella ornithinolytica 2-156-04_S1_C2]|nr:hypothetical protein AB00_2507 [Raoultella ornithinolytica 2-156-04_S1_C1]KDX14589.1 hypothetical protein AB28_2692 [Raoultella ornithinolytica 2-156-04_S1_C2]